MIVSSPRYSLWKWLNERVPVPWSDDFRAIGLVRGGCLVAVIGYNGFVGRSCCMHSAIDDPKAINRTFVQAMFEYPFQQLDLLYMHAIVDATNQKAISLDKHVGFKEVDRLAGASLDGGDLVFMRMSRNECRWLRGSNHGRQEHPGSAGLSRSSGRAKSSEQGNCSGADMG